MSDEERLARVLEEMRKAWMFGDDGTGSSFAPWAAEFLRSRGVTLAAPAERLTPLQAAAEVVKAEFRKCNTSADWAPGEAEGFARAVLAAAVGALTDAALLKASAPTAFAESDTEACAQFRAALLAALTEGGEG